MSKRDIDFIKELPVTSSDIARALQVTRQAVSRGINKEDDYLTSNKLETLSEELPKKYDIDRSLVRDLINRFYPSKIQGEGAEQSIISQPMSFNGEVYIICNKLLHYYKYERSKQELDLLMLNLGNLVKAGDIKSIIFVFSSASQTYNSKETLEEWISDDAVRKCSFSFSCDVIEALPFAVCGRSKSRHFVYFLEDGLLKPLGRNNSRYILMFIKKVTDERRRLLKKLF